MAEVLRESREHKIPWRQSFSGPSSTRFGCRSQCLLLVARQLTLANCKLHRSKDCEISMDCSSCSPRGCTMSWKQMICCSRGPKAWNHMLSSYACAASCTWFQVTLMDTSTMDAKEPSTTITVHKTYDADQDPNPQP